MIDRFSFRVHYSAVVNPPPPKMAIPQIPQQPEPIREHLCNTLRLNTLCGRAAWGKGMMEINTIIGVWA